MCFRLSVRSRQDKSSNNNLSKLAGHIYTYTIYFILKPTLQVYVYLFL